MSELDSKRIEFERDVSATINRLALGEHLNGAAAFELAAALWDILSTIAKFVGPEKALADAKAAGEAAAAEVKTPEDALNSLKSVP
jgi:phage-related tail protein